MNQNYYNHEKSAASYRSHISNIAYRFKFKVIYEDDRILKEENGLTTVLVSVDESPRNTLCWKAWLKLSEKYDYSGIWKDRE